MTQSVQCELSYKKQIPVAHEHEINTSKWAKVGRPKDKDRTEAFLEVTSYLEDNDNEQITGTDLVNRMEDKLAESEHCAYSKPHMLQKLQEHFSFKQSSMVSQVWSLLGTRPSGVL